MSRGDGDDVPHRDQARADLTRSTSRSASSYIIQVARPPGGGVQARATTNLGGAARPHFEKIDPKAARNAVAALAAMLRNPD